MIYHQLALNVPLYSLLTYAHPTALPAGTRVAVRFRKRLVAAIVWESNVQPKIDINKILPIETILSEDWQLPADWRALLSFTARYYHYPLGQAVMAALPKGLRQPEAVPLPHQELMYTLSTSGRLQPPPPARFHKQHALWQCLQSAPVTLQQLKAKHTQATNYLNQWQQQGWVQAKPVPVCGSIPASPYQLNQQQQHASTLIQAKFGQFAPFLLYGITGSGKTEVYFDIMAKVLQQGRQVLFLLPEINLTPQLMQRVRQRFPSTVTVILHSQTAAGQRTSNYLQAALGQAALVIGTRLAVFTPMHNLGLIVVDEEHDYSFKQESELRYQARDLAVWRAQQINCPIVLGSATPSLESWYKAQQGAYQLLQLSERAHASAQLPQIHLLDIRRLPLDNGLSDVIKQKLQANFANGGLSMIYLNRRGFAPALFCTACGHIFGCPNCSAKMVLHQHAGQLRCHHCDFHQRIPHCCPECGNQDLTAVGQGTQRIEEYLQHLLPDARILRVDRDNTAHRHDWAAIYSKIMQRQIDILVGTQMLAKGHDFPHLNLVVVLNADNSLYSADFRAPERLFAELMQVSGRAGRANYKGEVWVQTRQPEHKVYQALSTQNYVTFATAELAERQELCMPPFSHMAAIRADAKTMREAQELLRQALQGIEQQQSLPTSVSTFGPVPMLMARLAGYERAQIFLESKNRRDLHHSITIWHSWLQHLEKIYPHTRWLIDVDPLEM
ncbi:primosomal protein N' [Snodgrassella communis]|uniref:Replication restart protein PriA n=2 Tax=Snodgrassella TaxID=1193515 RepID=A0A2N9XQD6_9NEIS|nr:MULTISPECIES: primosomal protein N' [Snodgrassella]KDN14866.1 Helicase PriA essential for oriC/DnaA-independent DNA replication [Snodgrassella communis]PIT08698.1 primosomal protein N' [Snodgrassella communis]PIT29340.1 primosomal protein N' [Snodgrassella communis]PIT29546.1 primosomal protein N' [Snodgrassella communis]PIT35326.1 primosomal protein N' [Snodgrassella communis]